MRLIDKINKYGVEWVILEIIAKGDETDNISSILDEYSVNWGEIIEQSMNHKILPLICSFFLDERYFIYLPPFLNQYFVLLYKLNIEKNLQIKKEAYKIGKVLEDNNIDYVSIKGVVLDNYLYENNGSRFLSDADFFVEKERFQEVRIILEQLGYTAGTVDWRKNKITNLTRKEHLLYLTSPSKLPEYVKNINDSIVGYVSLGFSSSFLWDSSKYNYNMSEALERSIVLPMNQNSNYIKSLSHPDHFIYIILHLYKHAWLEYLSRRNNDVNLAKFSDVYRYWKQLTLNEKKEVKKLVKQNNLINPVSWVLYHTDELFSTNILEWFEFNSKLPDNYLNSAFDENGNIRYWSGNMRDRLRLKNRKDIYKGECL